MHIFHILQETLKELQTFIKEKETNEAQDSMPQTSTHEIIKSHDAALSIAVEEPPCKRAKPDPTETDGSESGSAALVSPKSLEQRVCVVCLGILQDLCGPAQAKKVRTCPKVFCFFN